MNVSNLNNSKNVVFIGRIQSEKADVNEIWTDQWVVELKINILIKFKIDTGSTRE